VLVIGANGRTGVLIVLSLLSRDYLVRAIVRSRSDFEANLGAEMICKLD